MHLRTPGSPPGLATCYRQGLVLLRIAEVVWDSSGPECNGQQYPLKTHFGEWSAAGLNPQSLEDPQLPWLTRGAGAGGPPHHTAQNGLDGA